jgi:hypothetical protein
MTLWCFDLAPGNTAGQAPCSPSPLNGSIASMNGRCGTNGCNDSTQIAPIGFDGVTSSGAIWFK